MGKGKGERISSGIFTYANPKNVIEKNHNKEALAILANKQSHFILDLQAGGTTYLTKHRTNDNFLDFYTSFIKKNQRYGNRSLSCSLASFKKFINKSFILPSEITEELCERFRNYLLDTLNGETPADYFMRFRRVLKAATKAGYFRTNPADDIKAKSKPSQKKEVLDADDYKKLINSYCSNYEVKKAAIFCLYTGLRWCDVSVLKWESLKEKTLMLKQEKTDVPLEIPLHAIAKEIAGERKEGKVFCLPTQDGANKVLGEWVKKAGINKHITWHCLRHSISVLMQDNGTDAATVAGMLGHTTTKYIQKTYKRYKLGNAILAVSKLPDNSKIEA